MPHNINQYAAICAVTGWTDYESQEGGLFLQQEEAIAVNTALQNAANLVQELATANASVQQLTNTIAQNAADKVTTDATIQTQTEKIAALEARVAELGGEASGAGTSTAAPAADTNPNPEKTKLTLNSDEHELNTEIRRRIAAKKKPS